MNKLATSFAATALAIGAFSYADFPSTMIDPSVQIGNFCSGTVIADPYLHDGIQKTILTARHCVQAVNDVIPITVPSYVDMKLSSEITYEFKVAFISKDSDLAILQFFGEQKGFDLPEASIYEGDLEFSMKTWLVGFPLGLPKIVTEGYLGWINKIPELHSMSKSTEFQSFAINLMGGSSGGGLFVKDDVGRYQLIGTVSAGIMNMYSVSTPWGSATPLTELRVFIKDVSDPAHKNTTSYLASVIESLEAPVAP